MGNNHDKHTDESVSDSVSNVHSHESEEALEEAQRLLEIAPATTLSKLRQGFRIYKNPSSKIFYYTLW